MNVFRRTVRWLISRAANLTPNVVYYADGWPMKVNDRLVHIGAKQDGVSSPLSTAAIAMCCAMHTRMAIGDKATIDLEGVTSGGKDIGNFTVTLNRIPA